MNNILINFYFNCSNASNAFEADFIKSQSSIIELKDICCLFSSFVAQLILSFKVFTTLLSICVLVGRIELTKGRFCSKLFCCNCGSSLSTRRMN